MDQIWPLTAAVLFANGLTLMFLWGLQRAAKVLDGDHADFATLASLLVPIFIFGAGLYIYG